MDAYLINNGQEFSILYNKTKTLEETVEQAEESRMRRFARHLPLHNLTAYAAGWTKKIMQDSIGVTLTADAGQLVIHYAHTRDETEAREAFGRIVAKEIRRSNIAALVCFLLIPVTLPTPVLGTTVIFGSAVWQSIKIRQAIKQCAEKASYKPDERVTGLECRIIGDGSKSTKDYFSEYDFT